MPRRAALATAVALAVALVAACSGSGGEQGATTTTRPATTTTVPDRVTEGLGAPDPAPFDARRAFSNGNPLLVHTPHGTLKGAEVGATRQFQSIPYAPAPVGDLRWKAPGPAPAWTGTRDATGAPPVCTQVLPVVDAPTGQEDCLYLNVVTPRRPQAALAPVMVWFHGGGFTTGSSNDDVPTALVERTGAVVVTVNYRLGPFGFLALDALGKEDPSGAVGTMGFLDQVAALRWVHDAAARFGGDPGNVTIFGESAGGISVCGHIMSPRSAGLFQRAIIESGPCDRATNDRAMATAQGERFVTKVGCDGAPDVLACLRAVPADEVRAALPGDPTFLFRKAAFWMPVGDGVVLPTAAQAKAELAAGDYNRVPVLAGVNRDEGRLFMGLAAYSVGAQVPKVTAADYADRITRYFGPKVGPEVLAQYPLADQPDPGAGFGQAVGDAVLACPAVDGAMAMAGTSPVYLYQYEHTPNPFVLPIDGIELGAFHAAELPYVFGGKVQSSGPITFTPAEQELSDTVMDAWARFARTGDPSGDGLDWPQAGQDRRYLVLDTPTSLAEGLKADTCGFWRGTGWSAEDAVRD